jgi:hypothetical protein
LANQIEVLLTAKNQTDAAFQALTKNLDGASNGAKKWTESQQRAAMAMAAMHKEALKLNAEMGKGALSQFADDLKGKFSGAAEGAAGNLGTLGSSMAALGPAGLAAAAGAGAVVAAIGAVLKVSADAAMAAATYGDKIADLAGKTDMSVQSLQAFDVMARTGNTTVEAISAGVLKMGRGIVEGSDAFRRLGLNVDQLAKMSPEEQFKTVAVAIEGLGSNAERSAARVAVFGKAGDELTTVLHEAATGATELGGALSDHAVAASADLQDKLDLMSTAWERVQLQFGAAIAQSPEVQAGLQAITDVLVLMATKIGEWAPAISGFFAVVNHQIQMTMIGAKAATIAATGDMLGAWKSFKEGVENLHLEELFSDVAGGASTNVKPREFGPSDADLAKAAAAYKKLQDEARKLVEEENKLREKAALQWDAFFKTLGKEESDLTKWVQAEAKARTDLRIKELAEVPKNYQAMIDAMNASAKRWEEEDKKRKADEKARAIQLYEDIASSFGMLGDLLQDLGVSGSNELVKIFYGFEAGTKAANDFKTATNAAQKAMAALGAAQAAVNSGSALGGAATGAAFGAQFGIIGAGIGAVGGALLGFFGKAKKAREEMEKLRGEFIKSAGGMDALKKQAAAAGVSLDGLFKQKNAEMLARNIDIIKAKLQDWDEAQKILKEGMEAYGIAVSDMGPRFAALELDEQAKKMALFFAAAIQVGANATAVTAGMKDEVLALVSQYQAAGLAIPAALRPVLEAMLKAGQLTNEAGEAYGSLEEAGFQFAETMEGALANLTEELAKLRQVLALGFHIPVTYDINGEPGTPQPGGAGGGGHHPPAHVPEFAGGGFIQHTPGGVLNRIAEREDEFAIPRSMLQDMFNQAAAANGGSNRPIVVHNTVEIAGRPLNSHISAQTRKRSVRLSPSASRRF